MTVQTMAPVRKQVTVQAPQALAFEVFCQRMGSWWNPGHHIAETPFTEVVIEPWDGGRWFERDADGNECVWGSVLSWQPPHRLVLGWQLDQSWAYDPDLVTEVEVRFVEEGPSTTRVELEHRNLDRFGTAATGIRDALDGADGWAGLLRRYAGAF